MRKLRRMAVAAVAAASFCVAGAAPAQADHVLTVCDNNGDLGSVVYDSGPDVLLGGRFQIVVATGQTYVRYNDVLVGVDTDPLTLCISAPVVGSRTVSVFTTAPAGYVGVGIQTCNWIGDPGHSVTTGNCFWVLRVLVNPVAPLFSCVYVNGVQQNPGCPL